MPKRMVDGEALWLSDKIKKLPAQFRLHYANWIPLAEANGVFEANPDRIYSRVYSFMHPSTTPEEVKAILKAMTDVGLIQIWEQDGKTWGYFKGIEKGRLPSIAHLNRYKNLPPAPPIEDE